MFVFWPPFGSHFGGVLGAQMEAKAIKKPFQKNIKNMMPKMTPNWSQRGFKMEPKSSKMKSWNHLVSRMAPKWRPETLQARFWRGFGTILGPFWSIISFIFCDFCMHSVAACCKQKHSKSQGNARRMQQRASKKQLLSSCSLALKSSLAHVNELSGPC